MIPRVIREHFWDLFWDPSNAHRFFTCITLYFKHGTCDLRELLQVDLFELSVLFIIQNVKLVI